MSTKPHEETRPVERATTESKLLTVTRSQNADIAYNRDRLRREKKLFTEELARTTDPRAQGELRQVIEENRVEQSDYEARVKNSSLRRKLNDGAGRQAGPHGCPIGIERRIASSPPASVTTLSSSRSGTSGTVKLTGYAAVFGVDSVDLGWFIEQIEPGAFSAALGRSDVRALGNHDSNILLGRTASKTLRLYEDKIGLKFYMDLIDGDPLSQAVAERVRRGDLSGCSFSFTVAKDRWEFPKEKGELDRRFIQEIDTLFDVGPVTWPAYPQTSVTVLVEDRQAAKPDVVDRPSAKPDVVERYDGRDEDAVIGARHHRLGQILERQQKSRDRRIAVGFRKAGRIRNRCRARA